MNECNDEAQSSIFERREKGRIRRRTTRMDRPSTRKSRVDLTRQDEVPPKTKPKESFVAPPKLSAQKSSGGNANATMELNVNILRGEGLAACDYNMFGQRTSSDPYVIVSVITEDEEILVGKTKTKTATLNPKWNATLTKALPPGTFKQDTYMLQLTVMDYDLIGEDDCMGVVQIPMDIGKGDKTMDWYEIPPESAPDACGRIQVAVDTKLSYAMKSFLAKGTEIREDKPGSEEEPQEKESGLSSKRLPMKMAVSATMAANKMLTAPTAVFKRTSSNPKEPDKIKNGNKKEQAVELQLSAEDNKSGAISKEEEEGRQEREPGASSKREESEQESGTSSKPLPMAATMAAKKMLSAPTTVLKTGVSATKAANRMSTAVLKTVCNTVVGQTGELIPLMDDVAETELLDDFNSSRDEEMAASMPERITKEEDLAMDSSPDRDFHPKSTKGGTNRRRTRRQKEGEDGERPKRVSRQPRRVTSPVRLRSDKPRPTKKKLPGKTTSHPEGKMRRSRSQLPKNGKREPQRRSCSTGPSSLLMPKGSSSRRSKENEESRRASRRPRKDRSEEIERKEKRSGRALSSRPNDLDASAGSKPSHRSGCALSSKPKDLDASAGSTSSRRYDDTLQGTSSSHRYERGEEKKRVSTGSRVSRSRMDRSSSHHKHKDGKRRLRKKTSRGESDRPDSKGVGGGSPGKVEPIHGNPSSQASKVGTNSNPAHKPNSEIPSATGPGSRRRTVQDLEAICGRLVRETDLEASLQQSEIPSVTGPESRRSTVKDLEAICGRLVRETDLEASLQQSQHPTHHSNCAS